MSERSRAFTKAVPASDMRTCSRMPERSLTYTKAVPASGMRTCSQMPERSLLYTKIAQTSQKSNNGVETAAGISIQINCNRLIYNYFRNETV